MENFTRQVKSLRTLGRCYPALYECDCPFLSRRSGKFRRCAELLIVRDLVPLVRKLPHSRPFVILFNRIGGALAEARILFLLQQRVAGCLIQVIAVEPLCDENLLIATALSEFKRFVQQQIKADLIVLKSLDAYADAVQTGRLPRADAVIVLDSDERADLIFTYDSLANRTAVARLARACCSVPLYTVRLGVDQCHGGASRHLHRSILSYQGQKRVVFQLFLFGFDSFDHCIPLFWLQGRQVVESEIQEISLGGGVELPECRLRRFFQRASFVPLYPWLYSFWRRT